MLSLTVTSSEESKDDRVPHVDESELQFAVTVFQMSTGNVSILQGSSEEAVGGFKGEGDIERGGRERL